MYRDLLSLRRDLAGFDLTLTLGYTLNFTFAKQNASASFDAAYKDRSGD